MENHNIKLLPISYGGGGGRSFKKRLVCLSDVNNAQASVDKCLLKTYIFCHILDDYKRNLIKVSRNSIPAHDFLQWPRKNSAKTGKYRCLILTTKR